MRKGRFAGLNIASAEAADRDRPPGRALPVALVAAAPAAVATVAILSPQPLLVAATALLAAVAALAGCARWLAAGRRVSPGPAERAGRFVGDFERDGCGWFWETDADGKLTYVSEPLAAALGRERAALIGRRFVELLLVEDPGPSEMQRPELGFHLSARFPFAGIVVTPNGRQDLCWSLSGRPTFDEVGRFLGFRGFGLRLSAEQRGELDTGRIAACDSLTGLPNRARMRDMLGEALSNAASRREGCALLLIDLDRFKQVNDTFGHPVGDVLLKDAAQRMAAVIAGEGQVGRLGGDEFEAVLPGVDEEGRLAALAERLIDEVSAPYVIRGHTISIGASVGIAISRPGKTLADALIKEADLALYAAKGAGRGTHRFFEAAMRAQESERQILEKGLRSAIAAGQLKLVFQPVMDAATGNLAGFEAFVRWIHPVQGVLGPADFLPLAEASGLIRGIGEWIIRTACSEAAKWPKHLRLSINLSAAELQQPALPSIVANALAASGLGPDRLELDINEMALLSQTEEVSAALGGLKALGVGLALDDFGSGPSSIHSLTLAPLDRVKIHPTLLRAALPDSSPAQAALRAVVDLAPRLGMRVTAEGVESLDDLALVRKLGCDEAQGFHLGRPMAAAEALELAARSKPAIVEKAGEERPPRYSLIRSGTMIASSGSFAVRLRNISGGGAMIESARSVKAGSKLELDLSGGVRVKAEVRWSKDGRIGLQFAEAFDVQRLGKAKRGSARLLKPDYLSSETSPDSPWAGRLDRLTITDIGRR